MKPEIIVIMLVVDMCLYEDDRRSTPVFPPEDLEYGRVKSKDQGDNEGEGEWRLVTVVWWHVFGNNEGCTDEDKKNSLVKGYGRVTVLEKYPQEVFHEFAFWDAPTTATIKDYDPNGWDSHDVHWEHTWVSLDDHDHD